MGGMDPALLGLLSARRLGVLVTLKRDGRPQLSNVIYAWDDSARTIRVSVTADRAKTANLRRDPRASFYVTTDDGWAYAVAEGEAELGAETTDPGDAAADDLVDLYRTLQGEHPDWDDYRAAMVAERRLVLRLPVERVYGMASRG
ncbi:PPOX class F420-dependent oxidoreductase [soil metagenome]